MIKKRVFIVGCPRSGTTLLQNILASHSTIDSFPESHFFSEVIRSKLKGYIGLGFPNNLNQFYSFLDKINYDFDEKTIEKNYFFLYKYVKLFKNILDEITLNNNKNIWIEKTPAHLHFIKIITKYFSNAKFIHIIRNGKDVVASLYDVTHKYPEEWSGARSIDQCINRWNRDIEITKKYHKKLNHHVLKFDDLLNSPKKEIINLCNFLDVDFENKMINYDGNISNKIINKNEKWKSDVKKGIKKETKNKFDAIFNEQQKKYITSHLNKL